MKFSDFGFKENPFSITPDPRYLFLSRGHEESLAHLIYGTGPNGGFVQLTGEVGTGKTMLVRSLLEQKLEHVDIALILNPRVSRRDFLAAICDELGIPVKGPPYLLKELSDSLTKHLLQTHEQGRHTVLVVDEAQNLSPQVLEQVRLLTNLETARHKLLRIILVGQPELQQLLARKDLRQVDQRITARYHLSPLSRSETARYIRHRLAVAGMEDNLFTPAALNLVYFLTQGVPRMINTVCERALLAIFITNVRQVTPRLVWRALREVKGHHEEIRPGKWLLAGLFVATVSTGVWWMLAHTSASTEEILDQGDPVGGLARINRPADAGVSVAPAEDEQPASADTDMSADPTVLTGTPAHHDLVIPSNPVAATVQQKYFSLWGKMVGPEVENVCVQARQLELRCLQGVVGWEGLVQLNRPVLLLKSDDTEQPLLVKKAHGDRLLVDDGGQERWVKLSEIEPQWEGDFVMLWRPALKAALLGLGSSGAGVTWLREQLSLADGEPLVEIAGQDQFDEKLQRRLQSFQRQNGLNADGIAGPWTMILLSNLRLPPDTPTLEAGD